MFQLSESSKRCSLEIYNNMLWILCSHRNVDNHKRSYSWNAWDFYQANQIEAK